VFNNSSLGMIKLEMLGEGYPEFETDHDPVDFAAISRGAGLFARRVEKPVEVADGIREVLACPGPALLDLVTDPKALSIPLTIAAGQVRASPSP
jgi:pyruvate dehydrogenase (quinone)